jgi:hypothetical protein
MQAGSHEDGMLASLSGLASQLETKCRVQSTGVTWSSRAPRQMAPTNDLNLSAQSSRPSVSAFVAYSSRLPLISIDLAFFLQVLQHASIAARANFFIRS